MLRHEHVDRSALEKLAPAEIRSRTVEALLDIIEAISRESPVIVIEDVHWIDPSTSELMTRLARLIRELPVLLVATMRPGETPRWAEERDANLLHLTRLQPQEIRRLVNAIAADRKMPSGIRRRHRRALGRHSDLRRGAGARLSGDRDCLSRKRRRACDPGHLE